MTRNASGPFDVKMSPQPIAELLEGSPIARYVLDKRYHGALDASARGEMLAAGTSTPGSAGYVAMEEVTGTLHGRTGTFVLQHSATMTRGAPHLSLAVVPDSGTGELAGLAGTMRIVIEGKAHSYEFDYMLEGSTETPPSA